MFRFLAKTLTLVCVVVSPALAGDITGSIRVIDADTIDVGDTRIRIFGIDAPEVLQTCPMPDGTDWACGTWASDEVRRLYQGKQAVCSVIDVDRYERVVATCFVDGNDIAETMASEGIAFPYERYSLDYVDASKQALFREVGLWRSRAANPADFRAATRASAGTPPPDPDCPIKGNISRSGKIYHMPWNADYSATRIRPESGERWFCSEAEARAAGWRPARN